MKTSPIALSVPLFFILIAVEVAWARHKGRDVYRFNDSINDLACGILSQVVALLTGAIMLGNYTLIFDHARQAGPWPEDNLWAWVLCFLGVDFFYYWYHRFSHVCAIGWAAHVVHHQSEEYNLTVALRQSSFQQWQSHLFYFPLAVAGFPPLMFATCAALNTVYQFWIHTRLVGRLGPLEWLFNTPSHHRVHHATDPQYLDRNYAGTFIVWDKLFGSFVPETTEPHYGVLEPLRSWNPLWANVHTPYLLFKKAAALPGLWNKVQVFFRAPGWMPAGMEGMPVEEKARALWQAGHYNARAPQGGTPYILTHFILGLVVTVAIMFGGSSMPWETKVVLSTFLAWTLFNLGGMFEQKAWLRFSEPLRLVLALALPWLLATGSAVMAGTATVVLGSLLYWFLRSPWQAQQLKPATL